ncbi:hypothetical protein C8J56DRAFT_1053026 [Mycena floridula]|nr:hypothetical protein C8J56DRAFT_1053026 [Mycena floridula]
MASDRNSSPLSQPPSPKPPRKVRPKPPPKSVTLISRLTKHLAAAQKWHPLVETKRTAKGSLSREKAVLRSLRREACGTPQEAEAEILLQAYEAEYGVLVATPLELEDTATTVAAYKRDPSPKNTGTSPSESEVQNSTTAVKSTKRKAAADPGTTSLKKRVHFQEPAVVLSNGRTSRRLRHIPTNDSKASTMRLSPLSSPKLSPEQAVPLSLTPKSSPEIPTVNETSPLPQTGDELLESPKMSQGQAYGFNMFSPPSSPSKPVLSIDVPSPKVLRGDLSPLSPLGGCTESPIGASVANEPEFPTHSPPADVSPVEQEPGQAMKSDEEPELRLIKPEDIEVLTANIGKWGLPKSQLEEKSVPKGNQKRISKTSNELDGFSDLNDFIIEDTIDGDDDDGEFHPDENQGDSGEEDGGERMDPALGISQGERDRPGEEGAGEGSDVKPVVDAVVKAGGSIVEEDSNSWAEGFDSRTNKVIDPNALTRKLGEDARSFYARQQLQMVTGIIKGHPLLSDAPRVWWMRVAEMLPHLARESKALLTALMSNSKGNISCRWHSLTTKGAAAKQGDATYYGHDITGRSGPRKFKLKLDDKLKVEREPGFLSCGCEEVPAMLEVILWKEGTLHTTIVDDDGREDVSEPWRAMTLGVEFNDFFTHNDDGTPKPFHRLETLEKRIAALTEERDSMQDQIAARTAAKGKGSGKKEMVLEMEKPVASSSKLSPLMS